MNANGLPESDGREQPSRTRRPVGLGWLVLVVLMAAPLVVAVFRSRPDPNPDAPTNSPPEAAPLAALTTSPFLNARLEVEYVGDRKCLGCHPAYEGFREHPMGRSLFTAASAPALEKFDGEPTFRSGPFRFQVIHQGGQQIHREWCEDSRGKIVAEQRVAVEYAIGSGAQSRSYLFRRGNAMYESPITWYVQKGQWDLSPGYHVKNDHFTRTVTPKCLFCHSQSPRPIEQTLNGYRNPPFDQLAIGCERCHGPGGLHPGKATPPGAIDYTIVNPRHLEPSLRDDVCAQCHLQGAEVTWRRGRSAFEYRPGLPLSEYVQVFVLPPELETPTKIVSHAEQMHQSACFVKSAGRFGCTSCHNPHHVPSAASAVPFYQTRCQHCHGTHQPASPNRAPAPDCSVSAANRVGPGGRTDCLACHMPRKPAETVHLAVTDHRVLRQADRPRLLRSGFRQGDMPLVPFYKPRPGKDDPDAPRDLGLTVVTVATQLGREKPGRAALMRHAEPLLDQALARDPTDVPALEAHALVLIERGENALALTELERALAQAPNREQTLMWAAEAAFVNDQLDVAEVYCRRLVANYPRSPAHHERLAEVLEKRKAWPEAIAEAREAIRGDPFRAESRGILIAALLGSGDVTRAREELAVVGVIDPTYQKELRERFAELSTPGK